jgi:hypothetical protein
MAMNRMTNPQMGMPGVSPQAPQGQQGMATQGMAPFSQAPQNMSQNMSMNGMTNPQLSLPMPGATNPAVNPYQGQNPQADPWMEASRTTLGAAEIQQMQNAAAPASSGWPAPNSTLGSHQGYLQNMTGPLPNQMQNPLTAPNQAPQQLAAAASNAPPPAMSPPIAAQGMSWLSPEMIANSQVNPQGPAPNPAQTQGQNPWLAQQKPGWQAGQNPGQNPGPNDGKLSLEQRSPVPVPLQKREKEEKWG